METVYVTVEVSTGQIEYLRGYLINVVCHRVINPIYAVFEYKKDIIDGIENIPLEKCTYIPSKPWLKEGSSEYYQALSEGLVRYLKIS